MDRRIPLLAIVLSGAAASKLYSMYRHSKLFFDKTASKNSVADGGVKLSITPMRKAGSFKHFELLVENETEAPVEILWSKTYAIEEGQTSGGFYFNPNDRRSTETQRQDIVFPKSSFRKSLYPAMNIHDKIIPPIPGTGMVSSQVITVADDFKEGEHGIYLSYKTADKELSTKLMFVIGHDYNMGFLQTLAKMKKLYA